MSEASDDILSRPLGLAAARPAPRTWRAVLRTRGAAASALFGALALTLAVALSFGDPRGGEPRARAAIAIREAVASPATAPPGETAARVALPTPAPVAAPALATPLHTPASEIERASGVVVTRSGGGGPEQAVIVRVPSPDPVRLAAAPDPRLSERSRHGTLPRLGEGRLRALDVYARPEASPGPGGGEARIALLVSGIGTGQAATAAAIARLPPPVSLALSPYASESERIAARAREAGHEILVQAPMEPFDFPDSDPGPQTLMAGARPAENIDRLAFAMGRAPGLVGVVNLMGAKLLAEPAALEPVLREVAARGLGFVDDGTAQDSRVPALSARTGTPSARASIVIDALPRPDAIDRELARAEAQAHRSGLVLVSSGAGQMSIDRIARWSRDLEARGVRLVPVSAVLRAEARPAGAGAAPVAAGADGEPPPGGPAGTRVSHAGP